MDKGEGFTKEFPLSRIDSACWRTSRRKRETLAAMDQTSKHGWLILGGVWFINLFLRILMMSVSPLLPLIIADFELSHSVGGFLYSLPVLMIALFSFPLGMVSDRIGIEKAVGCGVTVAILSSLSRFFSPNFFFLVLFTALFGFGFAFCFPNLAKLVKEHFPPRLAGTATGIYTTAMPLGAGLGVSLSGPLLNAMESWRGVFMVWGLMATPVIVLWWVVTRRSTRQKGRPDLEGPDQPGLQKTSSGHSLFRESSKPVLICGLLLTLLNLIFYCTLGWLPTYLNEREWDSTTAAAVTSLISYVEIPAVFLIPLFSDRVGKRKPIITVSFLVIAICSVILSYKPSVSWWLTPVLGITFGGVFALLLALPVELVEKEMVGRAAGAIISIGYIGALIGPPAVGYLRDLTGGFDSGFLIMGLSGIGATGLSFLLPETRAVKEI
jgi:CP family cyanate transporter-like MFS transporter